MPPKNLRIRLNGRHDLEEMSLLLQKVNARLQDQGVRSVENCALYLAPLNPQGERMELLDQDGERLEAIEISLPVADKFIKATNG